MYPLILNQNCTMHAWLLTFDLVFQWWSLQSSCVCVCLLHRRNGTDTPGAVCAVTNVRWSDCCQPRQSMCLSFSINICDLTWLGLNLKTDDNAMTLNFPFPWFKICIIYLFLIKAVTTNEAFANATGAAFDAVQSSHGTGSATVAEMIMTLFLTMVVSMGAVNGRTRSHLAPFCIGLTVTANILAG